MPLSYTNHTGKYPQLTTANLGTWTYGHSANVRVKFSPLLYQETEYIINFGSQAKYMYPNNEKGSKQLETDTDQ